MIEFALSSLILITLFIFTFQFGYTFYIYNRLQTAVRNGARDASVRKFYGGNAASITAFKDRVKNMVVYSNPNPPGGTPPIAPGLTTAAVTVNITNAAGTEGSSTVIPDRVLVYISNYQLDVLFRTYTFTSKPVEAFPYVGLYLPTLNSP
jgi:Flp pilus assembly protein TadG